VPIRITTGATSLYMGAARRFSRAADALDNRVKFDIEGEPLRNQRSHELIETTVAAVMLSYSAVEAVLNELFEERTHFDQAAWFKNLEPKVSLRLNQAWSDGIEKLNPIDKAKVALAIADCSVNWDKGAAQEFILLHALRNALIHHKPFSIEPNVTEDTLEKRLRHRFEPARIWVGANVNFRWGGALGAGCALWAYKTAEGFQAEFFGALDCDYPKPWPPPGDGPELLDAPVGRG
jgi:hypothetical protein